MTACCGLDEVPRFTVLSEKGTRDFLAKPDMTLEAFLSQCTMSRTNGKILRWAVAFPIPKRLTVGYAAIWTDNPNQVAWKCTAAMSSDDFKAEFDANDNGWVRPSVLIPTVESPLRTKRTHSLEPVETPAHGRLVRCTCSHVPDVC